MQDNDMVEEKTRSFMLTILFHIVVGIIVSTPGGHLESPTKRRSASASTSLQILQQMEERLTGITLGLLDKRSREVT